MHTVRSLQRLQWPGLAKKATFDITSAVAFLFLDFVRSISLTVLRAAGLPPRGVAKKAAFGVHHRRRLFCFWHPQLE